MVNNTKEGIIYKATSPSGKVYIGQTVQSFLKRKKEHRHLSKKLDTPFYRALRKYRDQFCWEIIHNNVPEDMLNELEQQVIFEYKSYKCGYNATPGGEGYRGENHPMFGKKHSNETRKKMSEAHIDRKYPPVSESVKNKIAISLGKPFLVFKNDKYCGFWINQNSCAKALGLTRSAISMCLNGFRKSHKGYTFSHV